MAEWRLRNPGEFDPLFHEAMVRGPGLGKVVWSGFTLGGAQSAQKRFRLFRYCLRQHPHHPSGYWEARLYHRTRIDFDERSMRWQVLLDSKQSALSELKNPEVLD